MSAPHLDATVAGMRDAGIDLLVLGREANARYVTGAERLWLAGTRPFAPGCVVVASTGAAHLLSITDVDVPAVVPRANLYPISWNPMAILANVAAIPGVAAAGRIGVDGMTPLFEMLLGTTFSDVEIVDGELLLRGLRRVKSVDEVDAITAAGAAARDALAIVEQSLRDGVTERLLTAAYEGAMTAQGTTTPAFEPAFTVAEPDERRPRSFSSDRVIHDGDMVHVRAGVLLDGWEGTVATTLVCGTADPSATDRIAAGHTALDDVAAVCVPGASVGALRAHGGLAVGVEGVGLGHEALFDDDALAPGMVVAVEVLVDGILTGTTVAV